MRQRGALTLLERRLATGGTSLHPSESSLDMERFEQVIDVVGIGRENLASRPVLGRESDQSVQDVGRPGRREVVLRDRDGEPLLRCPPAQVHARHVWSTTLRLETGDDLWFVQGYVAHRDPDRDQPVALELAGRFDATRLPPSFGDDARTYERATSTPEGQRRI
jgi:hypothetical protein